MHTSAFQFYWGTIILSTTAQAAQVAPLETVQIGPYYATNCKPNNNNLATLLSTLSQTLKPIITDLSSSTSSDAYTTFFKDVAYASYIGSIFSNITTGSSVPPEPGAHSSPPIFICVDDQNQVSWNDESGKHVDAYTRCRAHGDTPAVALLKTPYIVICPVFFTQASIPPRSTTNCLTVDVRGNRFVQNGKSLVKYQLWLLLHELVHYYVYSTVQRSIDVYGVNACLGLPGRSAVLNAQSYVYYAANVWLGCTNFPVVRTRPPGRGSGVELLETDANGTAVHANESIALVVRNVSVRAVPLVQTAGKLDPDMTS